MKPKKKARAEENKHNISWNVITAQHYPFKVLECDNSHRLAFAFLG